MMIQLRDPAQFSPSGSWHYDLVGSGSSASAPYEHGSGTFVDVTNASSTKTWSYTPGRITDADTIEYTQDVAGAYKVAQVGNGKAVVEERLDLTVAGGGTYARCTGFVEDSVAAHTWGIVQTLLDEPDKSKPLMSGASLSPTCWAAGFDWSGLVIWNSETNGPVKRGVLISPRHLWLTKHFRLPVGTRVRFPNGTERRIVAVAYNGALGDTSQDEYVALLDANVPSGVNFFKVAGDWLATYETLGAGYEQLMFGAFIYVDQNNDVLLAPAVSNPAVQIQAAGSGVLAVTQVYDHCEPDEIPTYAPVFEGYEEWMKLPTSGDSSSGVFVPLDEDTLAVATVLTGIYGGESYHNLNGLIAAADASYGVSTGYTVTVATDPTA